MTNRMMQEERLCWIVDGLFSSLKLREEMFHGGQRKTISRDKNQNLFKNVKERG